MKQWDAISDEYLLRLVARRDREAFEAFYLRHSDRILGMLRSKCRDPSLADDLLQDVFLSVWRGADGYSARRGDVGGWLYTISRNKLIDAFRYAGGGPAFASLDVSDIKTVAAPRVPTEKRVTLRHALAKLSVEQHEALATKYLAGFTYDETAARLNLPLGTLKSRVRTGMGHLRRLLKTREVVKTDVTRAH